MNISENTFGEWWAELDSTEKDRAAIDLASACNVSLSTPYVWGRGYRIPKLRNREIITDYVRSTANLDTDCTTLFPA